MVSSFKHILQFSTFFFQADSLKKSLKTNTGGSLDTKLQQVKELEEEVMNTNTQ